MMQRGELGLDEFNELNELHLDPLREPLSEVAGVSNSIMSEWLPSSISFITQSGMSLGFSIHC